MSNPRSGAARTLSLGVGAAALAAVAAGKPWAVLSASGERAVPGAGGASGTSITSAGQAPLALALALVALAGWGAVLVTRGWFRRAVAGLGAVASVGLVVVVVVEFGAAPSGVRRAVSTALGSRAASDVAVRSGWYWAALVASMVLVLAYLVTVRRLPSWPSMGTRYDAPGAQAEGDQEPATNLEIWRAIDQGDDPTGGAST